MQLLPTFVAAMLVLLSPSKTMATDDHQAQFEPTTPQFMGEAETLMTDLKQLGCKDIEQIMKVSTALADEVQYRCDRWQAPFTEQNSRPAAFTFKGAVYTGLNTRSWAEDDMNFAQEHLRILSGLYGILRPKDLMQHYRLEMGLKWPNTGAVKNLYAFWGAKIKESIQQEDAETVVNLASNEYSKAAQLKTLKQRVITPVFKDLVKGEYKALMAYAKEARGTMAKFIIQNRITDPIELKMFNGMGYQWDASQSDAQTWLFTRDKKTLTL